MDSRLTRTGIAGLGDLRLADAMAKLFTLVSDAVLVFDEDGTIRLANDAAERLFERETEGLVGLRVRELFVSEARTMEERTRSDAPYPFELDGSRGELAVSGTRARLRASVRCESIGGSGGPYLLVARPVGPVSETSLEHQRLVEELSRANKRLSGTLQIVLGTLDSLDVGTLFVRILSEIADTLDAWAAMAYMAESDKYCLRGVTESLEEVDSARIPSRLGYDHPLVAAVTHGGSSMRLGVRQPSREELRAGQLVTREVIETETGVSHMVEASELFPFASFVLVPVWFGGHMICLIVVGWRHAHTCARDDAKLLDAVAEYLSVQLAGAYAALRAQHEDQLEAKSTALRERLLSGEIIDVTLLDEVFHETATLIEAQVVPLLGNPYQPMSIARVGGLGGIEVPFDLTRCARERGAGVVIDLEDLPELTDWLAERAIGSLGLVVCLGQVQGSEVGYLLVRQEGEEPFEDADVSFVRRLAHDVIEVEAGERARTRDRKISLALQQGMRNQLQAVEGLSTESSYSSATDQAYVGGDFYDLVRLGNRRCCVVMGDVSGKGVEAASVSSAVKTALSAYAWEGLSPARMVSLLNDFLLGFSRIETFATLFVGILDIASHTLTYCSAGHPPALLVRAATHELVTLGVQSGVVGAFEGFHYRNGEVGVGAGDVLVLYTDGVTEARSPQGAFFGEDGLCDVVSREVAGGFEGLAERIIERVSAFAGGSLNDDVALVVARVDE